MICSEACWIGLRLGRSAQPCCGLNLLEPRLVESHTTVIIPSHDRVIFVSLLNCAEFSSRLSEVAQTLDAISGIQVLVGGRGLGERWLTKRASRLIAAREPAQPVAKTTESEVARKTAKVPSRVGGKILRSRAIAIPDAVYNSRPWQ
jgi:hypothetical protein